MGQRVVALELAGEFVRAAVADRNWNSYQLMGVFERERGAGEEDLSGALARVIEAAGKPDVTISALPGEFVAKRLLELPFGDSRRLQQVVPFALEEHLPFAVDDAAVAFSRVGKDGDKTLVLAALARKADLEKHFELMRGAGLDPKTVTLVPFALAGILGRSRNGSKAAHVVLDIDHGSTSMVLIDSNGMPRALRTMGQGLSRHDGTSLPQAAAGAILGTVRQTLLAHGSDGEPPQLILTGPAAGQAEVHAQIGDALAALVQQVNDFDCSGLIAGARNEPARFAACIAMLLGEAPSKPLELLNFRQGEFAFRARAGGLAAFRVPMILGGIAVAFALLHLSLGIAIGARQLQLINREIASAVAPALGATTPVLAQPALETKLKDMRTRLRLLGGNLGHGSPLDLLLALSQAIPPGIPAQVYDLQIDDTGVKIQATADSYGAVDQVKKALERSPQLTAIKVDHAASSSEQGKIDFTISTGSTDATLGAN
jgi:hypothetical protein